MNKPLDIFDHISPQADNNSASPMVVSRFMEDNYKHFNAGTIVRAAAAYSDLITSGGKMFVSLAGAMSTAELGITLAEMIRQGKIHAISCTGANLEEDLFNLVAHSKYVALPKWRNITPAEDEQLLKSNLPRVTDVCIPEKSAMDMVGEVVLSYWKAVDMARKSMFPHEFLYQALLDGKFKDKYEIDPKNSWLLAAAEKNIPIYVPGWEDSTLGNFFVSQCMSGEIKRTSTVKGGIQYMIHLCDWYKQNSKSPGVGFFQIGGGIAGDFAICAVPLLNLELDENVPLWSYFCQITDATTSYGGYSGALPDEKITWGKIGKDTPNFAIDSDATIVAPLIFSYVLGL